MATLYDALLGDAPSSNDYLANDPYFRSAQAFETAPPPAYMGKGAMWANAFSNLIGGALQGYGRRHAMDTAYSEYAANPMLKQLAAQDPTSPYAASTRPEGWTPNIGKQDLAQAAINQQLNAERMTKALQIKEEMAKAAFPEMVKQGLISPSKLESLLGTDTPATALAVNPANPTPAASPTANIVVDPKDMSAVDRRKAILNIPPEQAKNLLTLDDVAAYENNNPPSKDTKIEAKAGIENLDKLVRMADDLPDSTAGRFLKGLSPATNEVTRYDQTVTAQANAFTKQLVGRVNETDLKAFQTLLERRAGDSKEDIKGRLVTAQLWLQRALQGDTGKLNIDEAKFARERGVDPKKLGIMDSGSSSTTRGPDGKLYTFTD